MGRDPNMGRKGSKKVIAPRRSKPGWCIFTLPLLVFVCL